MARVKSKINVDLLDKKIEESGKTKTFLAKKINCDRSLFYKKCKGETNFNSDESIELSKEIDITTAKEFMLIFFPSFVDKSSTT